MNVRSPCNKLSTDIGSMLESFILCLSTDDDKSLANDTNWCLLSHPDNTLTHCCFLIPEIKYLNYTEQIMLKLGWEWVLKRKYEM